MSVFVTACASHPGAPPLAVEVPRAPKVCDRPAAAAYAVGEKIDRRLVAKVANERDAALLRLDGCREGWNAMAERYRRAGRR